MAHSAPTLKELLKRHPKFDVDVVTSTAEQEELVRYCLGESLSARVNFIALRGGERVKLLLKLFNMVMPARRYWMLRQNLEVFRQYDAIIVPEWTSLMLRQRFGLEDLKFIFTHHGAGDRAVSFNRNIREFDFVLLPGQKFEDVHLDQELVRDGDYAVTGYPKFDFVKGGEVAPEPLFDNDNPTVLYNPHFDPHLSSWYEMGEAVMNFFKANTAYNLIFAPHVMLFQRAVHTSVEKRKIRFVKALAEDFKDCPNIHIDLGSQRSVDMTYTRAADIYLGDVSSQIYEFIEERRPCIFLDSHDANWEGNPFYRHWTFGPVIDDISKLPQALETADLTLARYRMAQETGFHSTFDLTQTPSSVRAASAIAGFLNRMAYTEANAEAAAAE
ncbi:hypothetical protein AB8615_06425 [Litorimonas sp. RW-G-Af-16]|uniref:hypothetical protein n=1 Tax=Litorimonas sp. RW-G-Af-16 TaxID=3241168 RepID=UPI003AB10572